MPACDKIIVVTRKTALDELIERFNSRDQARFYIEHMGGSFDEYQLAHDRYQYALGQVRERLPSGVRTQFIDRGFVPTFLFGPRDAVVTLGPDGLVVNVGKYLNGQPLIALNPDPERIDGVLVPFYFWQAETMLQRVLSGTYGTRPITMAQAKLNDGQTIYAVNDLFIGQKTHVSARYRITHQGLSEHHSSSGVIVSTGAGSSGWLRAALVGAAGISEHHGLDVGLLRRNYRFNWSEKLLKFFVREPFPSRATQAQLVFGNIHEGESLNIVSQMPQNGVIFSDGIEADYLKFDSGAIAQITIADRQIELVV